MHRGLLLGEIEMLFSPAERNASRGEWRSGKGHAAHLGYYQRHVDWMDDRKICTSAPKDNLMMLTYYNMLPSIKVQDVHKGKHAPWLRGMRLKMPMQKTAIMGQGMVPPGFNTCQAHFLGMAAAMSRMLARNAHIPQGHHLNPPQQPRIAIYKTLHKGNHKG